MGSISESPDSERIHRINAHAAGERRWSSIPELVGLWRDVLRHEGPLDLHREVNRWTESDSAMPKGPVDMPPDAEARVVRLDNDQVIWLRTTITGVAVLDKPPRTDSAMLAALTALECPPIDVKRLRKALPSVSDFKIETIRDLYKKHEWLSMGGLPEEGVAPEESRERYRKALENGELKLYEDLHLPSLWYAVALIRYFRPDFDDYPRSQQIDLVEHACQRLNKLLNATRQLMDFLEYGDPERDLRQAIENAKRDVRAAVLRDVQQLKNTEIGMILGLDPSDSDRRKGDNDKARKRIKQGRRILAAALGGEEGWQRHAADMKAELARMRSLTKERFIEGSAKAFGVSADDEEQLAKAVAEHIGGSVEKWRRTLSRAESPEQSTPRDI